MLKIGLTGGIGSGKSAVSGLFEKLDIPVIDTDMITHQLLANDRETISEITTAFSREVLGRNNQIDRKKLAAVVFKDSHKKKLLEEIIHKTIRQHVIVRLDILQKSPDTTPYVIIVIPLLFETGFDQIIDRSLVVLADEMKRIERVMARDHRDIEEIRSIMSHQVDDQLRQELADDIIENNDDISSLRRNVLKLHQQYLSLSGT